MKSNEVGTTLKHPETINGNVKNLSKKIKENVTFKNLSKKIKENVTFINITINKYITSLLNYCFGS
jgi:hypothetical protein